MPRVSASGEKKGRPAKSPQSDPPKENTQKMGRAKTAVSEENGIWAVPARKTTTPRYLQAFSLEYILAVIRVTVLSDTWAREANRERMHDGLLFSRLR